MKALIVEDDPSSAKILEKFLKVRGECVLVPNGEEAKRVFLDALGRNQQFDLICLDIMMPDISGHEVLSYIRTEEERRGIMGLDGVKVIMTTALGDVKNVWGAFKGGCEAYVIKPYDKENFLQTLKRLGFPD